MRKREVLASKEARSALYHLVQTSPPSVADYYYPYEWTPSHRQIYDFPVKQWVTTQSGARQLLFKKVVNERWSVTIDHMRTPNIYEGPSTYFTYVWVRYLYGLNNGADLGFWAAQKFLTKVNMDAFLGHNDRWERAKPSMATRANLFVSLAELMDVKKMFMVLPAKHIKKCRNWKELLQWSHYANGVHLNYNFGWKPFVRDCENVLHAYQKFDQRLNRLLRKEGHLLCRSVGDQPEEISLEWEEQPVANHWLVYSLKATLSRHSSFGMEYDLPDYGSSEFKARAWLDALGLNPSIADLWALVPLSFVNDWFNNVGGVLEKTRNDWLQPWIKLYQSCSSVKVDGSLKVSVRYRSGNGTTYASPPVLSLDYHQYRRSVGPPSWKLTEELETDSLNADKIRLGASLIYGLLR